MSRMARHSVVPVEDDNDALEDFYFTYRPLSNLPTPPPSSRNSSADQSPRVGLDDDGEPLGDQFLGPSIHLANLVPTSASLITPSVPLVQSLLSRMDLPLEAIALAACILDSLNAKFALAWRLQCPLVLPPDTAHSPNKRHSLAGPLLQQRQLHVDSVRPELIILAAVVIATKFTEDRHESTQYYCAAWGANMWSCEQLNATERCICEHLNWRIKPLLDDEDLITETLVDMQMAVRQYRPAAATASNLPPPPPPTSSRGRLPPPALQNLGPGPGPGHGKSKSMSVGTAVMGLGLQLTPVDTPDEDGDGKKVPTDYLTLPKVPPKRGLSPVGEELDTRQ